jgi:mannose-1-phosphate guanylyltransferase
MAGGIGSRFWPMSKTSFPKQFLDILGTGETLIQMTYRRFLALCPRENIYVVTNDDYKSLVMEQLPEMKEGQVLCEPSRRNTAPCIAYAAYKIHFQNPSARMMIAPSDHLILKEKAFEDSMNLALEQADQGTLVTLGIKPSRPDTGYGYIQFVDEDNDDLVKKVKTFTEKPDLELAQTFLDSGDFYWNSGIFVSTTQTMINAFAEHLNEVHVLFEPKIKELNSPDEAETIADIYAVCANVSIDYGIMEKAKNVYVVLSDIGWSDLGTWGSLYTHLQLDENKNAKLGKNVRLYECSDTLVHSQNEKLMVLQGLDDYIVVDTKEALLVVKKSEEQKIKQFVTNLKAEGLDDFV